MAPNSGEQRSSFSFSFTSSLDRSFAVNLSSGNDVIWSFTSRGRPPSPSHGRSDHEESGRGRTSGSRASRYAYVFTEHDVQEFMT